VFQIQVRAARPTDADALTELIAGLSPRSSFLRFLAGIGSPGPRLVAALLCRNAHRGSWVAVADDRLVGHAMWGPADGAAEIGVVVADRWQGHGIGRLLTVATLREARARGHVDVRLSLHPENRDLLRRLARGAPSVGREDGMVTVRRPLADLLPRQRTVVLTA
jgi:GNAT superfamily N-acetyltransferase